MADPDLNAQKANPSGLDFLSVLTAGTFFVVLCIGFVGLMNATFARTESDKARWATRFDLNRLVPGEPVTLVADDRPVFVLRLSDNQIEDAQSIDVRDLPVPEATNANLVTGAKATFANRTVDWNGPVLVVDGVCGPFGHVAMYDTGDLDGWFCPIRGSHFDILGRVHKGPGDGNLQIPRYRVTDRGELVLITWNESPSEAELDRLLHGRQRD
ncbi:MAG: ubiquinol-cytochrome c reductase iron-sulfur subunit [Paracoccaceae bacterium]